MSTTFVSIACKKCRHIFAPDLKTRKAWKCTSCNAKNPNLRRHYRSVADLMILGLLVTGIAIAVFSTRDGVTIGVSFLCAHAALLLGAVIIIYRSAAPWNDRLANGLMWIVFSLAFLVNVVLPFVLYRRTGPVLIYALIFPYLFWLKGAAANSRSTRPSD